MSINNKRQKSNKHSTDDKSVEIIDIPVHQFTLVEPDEVLDGYTVEEYKNTIAKWLTNFNGALFIRYVDIVEANTNLTKIELLRQLNTKLAINLECLNAILTNTSLPYKNLYKNLDDFKSSHTFNINNISITYEDWAKVQLLRYDNHVYHPIHFIIYDLSKWTFNDYVLRNIVNYDIPYSDYLNNIKYSHSSIVGTKSINKAYDGSYNDVFNKFSARKDIVYNNTDKSKLDLSVTFEFNIPLYFSHIKYLYKIFNTFN